MAWITAAAMAGGAVLGSMSSKNAANTQANSANQASQVEQGMFDKTQQNLAPWMNTGTVSLGQLNRFAGLPGFSGDPAANELNFKGQTFANRDALHKALYDDYASQLKAKAAAAPTQTGAFGIPRSSQPFDPSQISEPAIQQAMSAATQANPGGGNDPQFGMLTKPFGMEDFKASPAYSFNLEQGQAAIDKAAAARHNFYSPATLQQIAKYSQGMASNEFQNAFSNYNTNLGNIWNRLYSLSSGGQNAATNMGGFGTTVGSQLGENAIGAGNAQAAGTIGSANAISQGVGAYYNNQLLNNYIATLNKSSVAGNPQPGGFDYAG